MVNAGTYPLWQQLAVTEGLPGEGLPAVVEALSTTSRAFYGVDNRGEESRKQAFAARCPPSCSGRPSPRCAGNSWRRPTTSSSPTSPTRAWSRPPTCR